MVLPMAFPPQVFQFHDIAAVSVQGDSTFVRTFFEAEYRYHHVNVTIPDLARGTNIDSPGAQPSLPNVFLDFHQDSASPEGYTHHTHKLLARWNYKLTIQPAKVDLHVHGNQAAVSMVHHMLVHPSLRWLACNRGTLLLHAGAVAKNNKSLIFTGKGGAGKTTITSLVLASDRGWQIHADDYVFLKDGVSKAYVTRSHLYRDLLNWVPAVRDRLTPSEQARLEFFGVLRKYTREGIKWPVRLGPQRLWPGTPIADTASTAAILLLERADISKPTLTPVTDLELAANDLLEMNFGEARHFLTLLQKANAVDAKWLPSWKDTERGLLASLLKKTPIYRLVLPFSQREAAKNTQTQANLMSLLDDLVK